MSSRAGPVVSGAAPGRRSARSGGPRSNALRTRSQLDPPTMNRSAAGATSIPARSDLDPVAATSVPARANSIPVGATSTPAATRSRAAAPSIPRAAISIPPQPPRSCRSHLDPFVTNPIFAAQRTVFARSRRTFARHRIDLRPAATLFPAVANQFAPAEIPFPAAAIVSAIAPIAFAPVEIDVQPPEALSPPPETFSESAPTPFQPSPRLPFARRPSPSDATQFSAVRSRSPPCEACSQPCELPCSGGITSQPFPCPARRPVIRREPPWTDSGNTTSPALTGAIPSPEPPRPAWSPHWSRSRNAEDQSPCRHHRPPSLIRRTLQLIHFLLGRGGPRPADRRPSPRSTSRQVPGENLPRRSSRRRSTIAHDQLHFTVVPGGLEVENRRCRQGLHRPAALAQRHKRRIAPGLDHPRPRSLDVPLHDAPGGDHRPGPRPWRPPRDGRAGRPASSARAWKRGGTAPSSPRRRSPTARCSSTARAAPARSWWRKGSTAAWVARAHSSPRTPRRCNPAWPS